MLTHLLASLKKSIIDYFLTFSVEEWKNNPDYYLNKIIGSSELGKMIVVRSSAICEDAENKTYAGVYKSVLNIPKNDRDLIASSIEKVVESFRYRRNYNLKNEIIVQRQLMNPPISGVIFTRDLKMDSPYYVIEYDDQSGLTNSITGSGARKYLKISKFFNAISIMPWSNVLLSIHEIEKIFPNSTLDVEFALDSENNVHIFQARKLPVTFSTNYIPDKLIKTTINSLISKYSNYGENSKIFSDMADWNPAEMLGSHPKKFSISLYRFLITQSIWAKSRAYLGYSNISNRELMFIFAGKPYIDIDASLRSLTPTTLKKDIRDKLIFAQLKELIENPYLHDKIEFYIAFSCSRLIKKDKKSEIIKKAFSVKETENLDYALDLFTATTIENIPKIFNETKVLLKQLIKFRDEYLHRLLDDGNLDYYELLPLIKRSLEICRDDGAYPFAILARLAFFGNDLIHQLQRRGIMTKEDCNQFFSSIRTVTSILKKDMMSTRKGRLSKNEFLLKYGHLRPGTYDITIPRYDQMPDTIFSGTILDHSIHIDSYEPKDKLSSNIEKAFDDININVDGNIFLKNIRETIKMREYAKFEFTHNLSDTLELIVKIGSNVGLSRENLMNLDINSIFIDEDVLQDVGNIKRLWLEEIKKNREKAGINRCINLPSMIINKDDFHVVHTFVSKPNFVTEKIVESSVILVNDFSSLKNENIGGKIIAIESADPGYDWIFLQGIAGLVTKYGGMASHMTVRCYELGIPAAIGCGDVIFEQIKDSNIIRLDAKEEKILTIG